MTRMTVLNIALLLIFSSSASSPMNTMHSTHSSHQQQSLPKLKGNQISGPILRNQAQKNLQTITTYICKGSLDIQNQLEKEEKEVNQDITCQQSSTIDFTLKKGDTAYQPSVKFQPKQFILVSKVIKKENESNQTEYHLTIPESPAAFNITIQSPYLIKSNLTKTRQNLKGNFSLDDISVQNSSSPDTAFHLRINKQSAVPFEQKYHFFGHAKRTLDIESGQEGHLKVVGNNLTVEFSIAITSHYQDLGDSRLLTPFDMYAIKLESANYPLLTYDASSLFPKCYDSENQYHLWLHNLFAGQRWRKLKDTEDQFDKEIFNQTCKLWLTPNDKTMLKDTFIKGEFKTKFLIKHSKEETGIPASVPLGVQKEDKKYYLYTMYIFKMKTIKVKGKDKIDQIEIIPSRQQLVKTGHFSLQFIFEAEEASIRKDMFEEKERKGQLIHLGSLEDAIPVFMTLAILFGLVIIVNYILIKTVRIDLKRYKQIEKQERKIVASSSEENQDIEIDFGDDDQQMGGKQPVPQGQPARPHKIPNQDIRAGGWKLISQDAQQPPEHPFVLVASIGAGIQLLFITLVILIWGSYHHYFANKREGTVEEYLVYLYVVGSVPGGFVAGFLYKKFAVNETKFCLFNLIATTLVIPLPLCIVMISINLLQRFNFFGLTYSSTKALPFSVYAQLFGYWLVIVALTIISGMLGRNLSTNPLIERSRIQRQLPKKKNCLAQPTTLIITSGLIQFIPVCVFYIKTLDGIWTDSIFDGYFLMLIEFLLLLLTVVTIGMASVYLILQSENHQWWKPTFSIGGALSSYTFCLSVLYFLFTLFSFEQDFIRLFIGYLSYNMLIGWAIYIMLGSVGFLSSFSFMRFLYSKVRLD